MRTLSVVARAVGRRVRNASFTPHRLLNEVRSSAMHIRGSHSQGLTRSPCLAEARQRDRQSWRMPLSWSVGSNSFNDGTATQLP